MTATISSTGSFRSAPSDSFSDSKVTSARRKRKNEEPSAQVTVDPPSAHAKESAPTSVSFRTGTEAELTFTVGASPPMRGTATTNSCWCTSARAWRPSGLMRASAAGSGSDTQPLPTILR